MIGLTPDYGLLTVFALAYGRHCRGSDHRDRPGADDGLITVNYGCGQGSDYRDQSNPDYGRITVFAVA